MDGDAGDADPGVEGREPLGPLAAAHRGRKPQRDQGAPEGVGTTAAELGLEDQADAGAGLEGVVREEPEGRAGGEWASQSHLWAA